MRFFLCMSLTFQSTLVSFHVHFDQIITNESQFRLEFGRLSLTTLLLINKSQPTLGLLVSQALGTFSAIFLDTWTCRNISTSSATHSSKCYVSLHQLLSAQHCSLAVCISKSVIPGSTSHQPQTTQAFSHSSDKFSLPFGGCLGGYE